MTLAELALLAAVVFTGSMFAGTILWVNYWVFARASR